MVDFVPQVPFFILERTGLPFNQNDDDSLVKHLFPPAPYNVFASTLSSSNTVKWLCEHRDGKSDSSEAEFQP